LHNLTNELPRSFADRQNPVLLTRSRALTFHARVVAIVMIAAFGLIGVACSDSETDQGASGAARMEDQGQEHVSPGQPHDAYSSIPAISGPHFGQPLAPARWGVHQQPLPDEVLVHNLEHGYVDVHYDCPEGCSELVEQLTSIVGDFGAQGAKVLLSPYPNMGSRIALTAWTYIETMEEFDEGRIVAFIEARESSCAAPEYNVGR